MYICSLAHESPSHLQPIPTPLGYHRQISYINTYVWNVEGWYWWTCLRSSNGDTQREQSYGQGRGEEEEGEMNGERGVEAYPFTQRAIRRPVGALRCFILRPLEVQASWPLFCFPSEVVWRSLMPSVASACAPPSACLRVSLLSFSSF